MGAAHPVLGAGPGRASLTWESDGTRFGARYAHSEYLQTFAELGAAGLVIVLALVVSIGVAARRSLAARVRSDCVRAGAAAGLAALAVHSGLDFLWRLLVFGHRADVGGTSPRRERFRPGRVAEAERVSMKGTE